MTSAGATAKLEGHGKIFGDDAAQLSESEDNGNEVENDPIFEVGKYTGMHGACCNLSRVTDTFSRNKDVFTAG